MSAHTSIFHVNAVLPISTSTNNKYALQEVLVTARIARIVKTKEKKPTTMITTPLSNFPGTEESWLGTAMRR